MIDRKRRGLLTAETAENAEKFSHEETKAQRVSGEQDIRMWISGYQNISRAGLAQTRTDVKMESDNFKPGLDTRAVLNFEFLVLSCGAASRNYFNRFLDPHSIPSGVPKVKKFPSAVSSGQVSCLDARYSILDIRYGHCEEAVKQPTEL